MSFEAQAPSRTVSKQASHKVCLEGSTLGSQQGPTHPVGLAISISQVGYYKNYHLKTKEMKEQMKDNLQKRLNQIMDNNSERYYEALMNFEEQFATKTAWSPAEHQVASYFRSRDEVEVEGLQGGFLEKGSKFL